MNDVATRNFYSRLRELNGETRTYQTINLKKYNTLPDPLASSEQRKFVPFLQERDRLGHLLSQARRSTCTLFPSVIPFSKKDRDHPKPCAAPSDK